ncbi:nuclear transport factor 2 family protein [Acidiferrimicrobium sp. IK]|uniref:nuclear transport factor 2 family protein n=1 Tax=Acidiferrimicrobium sp. IK TaxID=2871700 RepID=UPI0021CB2ABF|nr:nuclear transport factor 2 family protein [Acidiferrimicrobium sp. IK]MCU4186641.1 nuclear transport factor 2 family protein [Acidiferrimicrobium sp. IK]
MRDAGSDMGWQARSTLHRYCRAIDDHDIDALRDVFSEDVVLIVGGDSTEGDGATQSFAGRETVAQILASLFQERNWARHVVSNEQVEERGDGGVEVRSYFNYLLAKPDTRVLGVGDYKAIMRREGDRLRIAEFSASILDEVELPRGTTA